MELYDVLKKPIMTEKAEILKRNYNKYTFLVDRRANKIEIRKAVEKAFKVKVESVNLLNIKPEKKRYGQTEYKSKLIKKAIVKLKEGAEIKYYDGV